MKFKRRMSAISSSALVLGLSFLLFPQTDLANITNIIPTQKNEATPTPSVTSSVDNPVTDPVTSPTPEADAATPTPKAPYNAVLSEQVKAPISAVTDLVTSYIISYYTNDYETAASLVTDASLLDASLMESTSKNVARVENIQLYSKPGTDGVFTIVYADYSLYYNDLQISVPQFSEYYIKRLSDGTFRIQTAPLAEETAELFTQARQTEDVAELAISSLIRRYHSACLAVNEPLLKQCVTNSDYLNTNYIASRYSVTESFSDYNFILYPGINEFDYIAFVTHKEKIVFSDTPAPCMESYYISLDASGIPSIYLGITSLDTDAYCAAVVQSDEIQKIAKQTNTKMQEALLSDDDLKDFYQLLVTNASGNN